MPSSSILFIEDDQLCCLDTCEFLREHGYLITEAHNAAVAFDLIDGHAPMEALVTDIDLGPGTDGFEVARHARSVYPRLPVVFVSGTAAARHLAEGVDGSEFVSKPFQPQQLMEALDHVMHHEAV